MRATALRGVVLGAAGASCAISLFACGLFTSLDDLTGPPQVADDARSDERASPIESDAMVVVTKDAGTDTSPPFVLYLPPAGNYEYHKNTDAYIDGGDFEASVNDLNVDILFVNALNNTFRRPQASVMPSRVDYVDGGLGTCWTLTIQVLPSDGKEAHREAETFCARDGGLLDPGVDSTEQTQMWNLGAPFGIRSSQAVVDCVASNVYILHDMKPGDPFPDHACQGTATQTSSTYLSDGPYAYLGLEMVTTGDGATEQAFHTLRTRTVTGATSGNETTDFYLSARDGLPLRIHRHTHIDTATGFTSATYEERGSDWLLLSHSPK